jgi:hypothetical protein
MTVAELIEELSRMPKDAPVRVSVGDPKDTAFTDDLSVRLSDGEVVVDGWVDSENENACAPWAYAE